MAWYFLLQHHFSIAHQVFFIQYLLLLCSTNKNCRMKVFWIKSVISRNRFEHSSPRSISITEGRKVEVSYNLLDVSEVLKVESPSLKSTPSSTLTVYCIGGTVSVGGGEVQPDRGG